MPVAGQFINLGNVTFGLGVNTAGLTAAARDLRIFGAEIDRLAQSTQAADQATANAFAHMERGAARAMQDVLNLQAAMQRAGAPQQMFTRTSAEFQRLSRIIASGTATNLEYNRALDAMRSVLLNSSREFKVWQNAQLAAANGTGRFTELIRDLESASVLTVGPLSGLGSRVRALGAITSRSTLQLAAFLSGIAVTVFGMIKLTNSTIETAKALQQINALLTTATGSTLLAKKAFEDVADVSKRLGLDVVAAAEGYARFAAAARSSSLEGDKAKKIFEAVSTAISATRLSSQRAELVFLAFTQMLSKGKIQSEELVRQLSENLPGSLQIFANAITHGSIPALLQLAKTGQLLSEKYLPAVADEMLKVFGPGAAQGAKSLQGSLNNLNTAQLEFFRALDATLHISESFQKSIDGMTRAITFLAENMQTIVRVTIAASAAVGTFVATFAIPSLITIGTALLRIASAIRAITIAILANPFGRLAAILLRAIAAVLAFITVYKLLGDEMNITGATQAALTQEIEAFIKTQQNAVTATKAQVQAYIDSVDQQIQALEVQAGAMEVAQNAFERFGQTVRDVVNGVIRFFASLYNAVKGYFQAIVTTINNVVSNLTEIVTRIGLIGQALDDLAHGRGEAIDDLKNIAKPLDLKSIFPTAEEIRANIDEMNASLKDVDFIGKFLQALGLEEAPGKKKEAIQVMIKQLEDLRATLTDILKNAKEPSTDLGNVLSRGGQDAIDRIKTLIDVMKESQRGLIGMALGADNLDVALARIDATKLLDKLPPETLATIGTMLEEAGLSGDTLKDKLTQLILVSDKAKKKWDELIKAFRDSPEILRAVNLEIGQLEQAIQALNTLSPSANIFGPSPLEGFQRSQRIDDQVERMRKQLEPLRALGVDIDAILRRFHADLIAFDEASDKSDKLKDHLDQLKDVAFGLFDGLGKIISKAFTTGELKLRSFKDLLTNVLDDLVNFILQVTLLEPIKGIIGGFINASFGAGGGFNLFAARGIALAGTGRPLLLGRGGVLSKPTLLAGGAALASERGQSEGVLPLRRMRSGDLGVSAEGFGGGPLVYVNIFNQTDSNVQTKQRRTQNGGISIDVMIARAVAKNIRESGESFRAIRDTFGIRPAIAGR